MFHGIRTGESAVNHNPFDSLEGLGNVSIGILEDAAATAKSGRAIAFDEEGAIPNSWHGSSKLKSGVYRKENNHATGIQKKDQRKRSPTCVRTGRISAAQV